MAVWEDIRVTGRAPRKELSRIPARAGLESESFLMANRAKHSLRGTLGRKVKEFRVSLNMSQTELAERAKIQQPLISKMERGRGNPTLDSIERIAIALGVNVTQLLDPRR